MDITLGSNILLYHNCNSFCKGSLQTIKPRTKYMFAYPDTLVHCRPMKSNLRLTSLSSSQSRICKHDMMSSSMFSRQCLKTLSRYVNTRLLLKMKCIVDE